MRLSLIVAMSENRVIGRDGRLPWHLPADLRRFKRLTMGHHLIMGRVTFESLGRALPGRTSIVLSRRRQFDTPGVVTAGSFDQAVQLAAGDAEPFVIGGAELFREALPRVNRIYLTTVHAHVSGDTTFPPLDLAGWQQVEQTHLPADEQNRYPCTFAVYDRAAAA
jgi:dihydrofolate reductase